MKENFKCPKSGEIFRISKFIEKISFDGSKKYFRKLANGVSGEQLFSPKGYVLEFIESKNIDWSDGKVPHFGVGVGEDGKNKMKKILKNRSKHHFNNNLEDRKVEMIRHYDKTGKQL